MGPEGSSTHSQGPANCPYPEPDQSSLYQISCRLPFLTSHRRPISSPRLCDKAGSIVNCYGGQLLASRPTPKMDDHPLSAALHYLFNTFAVTVHIKGCCSIRDRRTRHAVVTETHLSWNSNDALLPCRMVRRTVW